MPFSARGVLQASAVIAKTTQTAVGSEISCSGYRYLTLFFTYTKGDETGLIIVPSYYNVSGGTAHADMSWTAAAGEKTFTTNTFKVTATGNYYITLDVAGLEFAKVTQGGSNNDGTPTGTLSMKYTLTGEE